MAGFPLIVQLKICFWFSGFNSVFYCNGSFKKTVISIGYHLVGRAGVDCNKKPIISAKRRPLLDMPFQVPPQPVLCCRRGFLGLSPDYGLPYGVSYDLHQVMDHLVRAYQRYVFYTVAFHLRLSPCNDFNEI